MAVMVAVPDSREGTAALAAAVSEARRLDTDLLVINLALRPIDLSDLSPDVEVTLLERHGKGDRDPAEAVLGEIAAHRVERLVIAVKRRTPVGKAILGSVSQRLLLDSPVPVLAVKVADGD